jgi:hypothetical protein
VDKAKRKAVTETLNFLFATIRNAKAHQRSEPEYEAAISVAYACLIAGFITGSTYTRIADLLFCYRRPSMNYMQAPKAKDGSDE